MKRGLYVEYEVVGNRKYRGHEHGTRFVARLDRNAAQRAINRRDLRVIRQVIPTLQPGSYRLPDGWPPDPPTEAGVQPPAPGNRSPEMGFTISKGD